jgi:timeless
MLERILILIRNILHIPIDNDSVRVTEDDTNPHDRILELMHSSGVNDLILFLVNNSEHQEFCFHMIEIISLMFREQNAEFIALSVANNQINGLNSDRRSLYEREQDRKELKQLRDRDQKQLISFKNNYNRFNGATYYIKNMKSISDRDLIYHKTAADLSQINFDANKIAKRKPKNRKPMTDNSSNSTSSGAQVIHRSTVRVRKLLNDFCVDFLNNSYNQFMRIIRDNLRRNISQDNDETYYLWAIQFFMEFNRCNPKTNDNSLVDETMSVSCFHYLHTQIEHYLDMMKTQKEDLTLWSKRLHYGLRAYRELLFSLEYLDSVKDEKVRKMAQLIKSDIFYEVEYRDLLLHLLHDYNEVKMSKAFLKDLIETNHIFLKMLEIYSKRNSNLMIKEKLKIRKKRKASKKKTKKDKTPPEEIWNEIVSTVSEALQGSLELPSPLEDVTVRAFDPTSEKTTDEQKMEVMRRVHHFLKQKLVAEAVALYRDARNVWFGDEDNAFGAQDILPEEELLSLNEVLLTDFPEESPIEEQNEEILSEEETEKVESSSKTREREFVFNEAILKYSHPNVVKNYALLLKTYDTNSSQTNHCIAKMLHRIAFDCKMHVMLFQVSIFRTFQRILRDPLTNSPSIEELSKFAKFIIGKFVKVAQKNKKVFMEILFWKNCREAYEIEEGYDQNANSKSNVKQLWTEEQELELNVLFDEYKDKADKDKDVVDLILENMIDETKTRRQLIIQLKRQVLLN